MTVRLAVLGCGAAARRLHLPALRAAKADIVCFASRTRASAEAAANQWGAGEVTVDWRAAVVRDDVDAVVVCTPNRLHAEMGLAAIAAGKHVLVEKPMATTLEDADCMIDGARRAGVRLVPAHNARFAPAVRAVRYEVLRGRIGEVRSFRAALGNAGPLAWSPNATWFLDPESTGGGALMDLGVHVADLLRAVLSDEIAEVSGVSSERTAAIALRSERGALGTFNVTWDASEPDVQLTLLGSEGMIHFDARTPPFVQQRGRSPETLQVADPEPEPYASFVRACAGIDRPLVTADDGRAALAIVLAAAHAARTGAPVLVR